MYERKHLIWGLSSQGEIESLAIMKDSIATDRQTCHFSSSWELTSDPQAEGRERADWE